MLSVSVFLIESLYFTVMYILFYRCLIIQLTALWIQKRNSMSSINICGLKPEQEATCHCFVGLFFCLSPICCFIFPSSSSDCPSLCSSLSQSSLWDLVTHPSILLPASRLQPIPWSYDCICAQYPSSHFPLISKKYFLLLLHSGPSGPRCSPRAAFYKLATSLSGSCLYLSLLLFLYFPNFHSLLHFVFLSGWLVSLSLQTAVASFFLCSHESMTPIPVCHLPVASLSFFSSPRLSFLLIPSYTEHGFASFPPPRLKGKVTVYSMPARSSNAQHHFQYSAPCFNDPLCSFCFSLHLSLLYTLHLIFF